MQYVDYHWDLNRWGLKLDTDLDIQKLGWEEGDVFKLVSVEGELQLVKMEKVEKFIRGLQ